MWRVIPVHAVPPSSAIQCVLTLQSPIQAALASMANNVLNLELALFRVKQISTEKL